MKYLNLNLEAFEYRKEGNAELFRVRVSNSPAGQQKLGDAETVTLPEDLRPRLRRLEKRSLTPPQMIALGEDLGAALFPSRVRDYYIRSLASLEETEGLRIRLMIDSYALSDIPWEYVYLFDADTPASQKRANGFLVFNPQISLVRFQMIGKAVGKIETVGEEGLRMVALLSNPGNTPGLDLTTEVRNIKEALKELPQIQAEFYPNVTIEKLLKILIKPAHIFHYAGHGSFQGSMGDTLGSEEGEGALAFTGEDGEAVEFPAEKLAMNLAGRGVRFAMLGACESGKVDQFNAWTGIAPALTLAGIPAVVGMQFKVLDSNAIAFSSILYGSLAAGLTIDEAVTKGRLAIYTLGDSDERDWGVPVLYLRAEEGVLFPKPKPKPNGPPPPGPVPQPVNLRVLREAIVKSFSLEDLEILCADLQQALAEAGIDLQVNLDIVGGNGKSAKVLNLIEYLNNRGRLSYLVKSVRDARPDIGI